MSSQAMLSKWSLAGDLQQVEGFLRNSGPIGQADLADASSIAACGEDSSVVSLLLDQP
jgi:hypothetical protein